MNPARDFGPKLFAYFAGWDFALTGARDIRTSSVPILAPIAGACFDGWLYPRGIGAHLPGGVEGHGCTIQTNVKQEEKLNEAQA